LLSVCNVLLLTQIGDTFVLCGLSIMQINQLIALADRGLRTLTSTHRAVRPCPQPVTPPPPLSAEDKALAGALMRVNHVGEVCAQALYQAQAMTARDAATRQHMLDASQEEMDHLVWTEQRLQALSARPSLLNPLWFAGAFAVGLLAGRLGDRHSLGFVAETERQVEAHLASHLDRLPAHDSASRAIVEQMKADEAQHAQQAQHQGAALLPGPVSLAMKLAAKVMTSTAHHI
jgi:3-demethoxyubiquinol 3-hydroxylase